MDLLVKPMQRLTKYSLLLKAILRKTDSEPDASTLKRMVRLKLISEALHTMAGY